MKPTTTPKHDDHDFHEMRDRNHFSRQLVRESLYTRHPDEHGQRRWGRKNSRRQQAGSEVEVLHQDGSKKIHVALSVHRIENATWNFLRQHPRDCQTRREDFHTTHAHSFELRPAYTTWGLHAIHIDNHRHSPDFPPYDHDFCEMRVGSTLAPGVGRIFADTLCSSPFEHSRINILPLLPVLSPNNAQQLS